MRKISPTVGIVLIFIGFCVLAILSFLFGLALANRLIPIFILYLIMGLCWGCLSFFALMKHVRTAQAEGKTIRWYKEGNLILIFALGLALIAELIENIVPDQSNIILKDGIIYLLFACFIIFELYAFVLLLRRH